MSTENGGGQVAPNGGQGEIHPRSGLESVKYRIRKTPDSTRTPDQTPRPESGGNRAETPIPAGAAEARGLAERIRGFFGKDNNPNVNPHDILDQVSKGALLSGEKDDPTESTRKTAFRRRETLTRAAKTWAGEHAHKGEIRSGFDQRVQEYRQTHDGAEPSPAEQREFYIQSAHASRVDAGQQILAQTQEIQNSGDVQQLVSERQYAKLSAGKELSEQQQRTIKTEAVVKEIRKRRSQQEQASSQGRGAEGKSDAEVTATADDAAKRKKVEAMLDNDRFKTIRAGVKDAVFQDLGISSLAEAKAKGHDPADILRTIHKRSETAYAEAPAESPADAEDQAITDKAKKTKQDLIDAETIKLFGDGTTMTYEQAHTKALEIAKTEIKNEDAKAQSEDQQAERDNTLIDLRGQLDENAVTTLSGRDNFDDIFTQELARYGNDPTGRELSDAYDRTLGRLHQEELADEASIRDEAVAKGEVVRAKIRITKEAGDIAPPDIDAQATKAAMDVIRKNRKRAAEARARVGRGSAAEAPAASGARAAESTAASENADATAERAEARKLRPKALLRKLGVDVKNEGIVDILDTLKDPANAELKKAFVDKLSRIQKEKAAAEEAGVDFDAKGAVDSYIAGYKEEDATTPSSEFAKKRFLKVLMEFLGAVALELAKATFTTSVEGLVPKKAS